uniref:Uncharacterized protein n=1 Tax=viral metagenome TaxID=1070528 RepID=A0A6C0LLQ6_9ZZZZ
MERKPLERKNSAIFKMNAAVTQSPATGQSPTMPAPSLDLRKSYGTNWTKSNVSVLFEWVTIAAYNIRCLELAITHYRRKIRANTILGIVLSTLSGTIATAQAGFPNSVGVNLTIILNTIFIVMSFSIAIMTGYIKIYQIQENLELNIKAKQDWISFSADIASELQLPIELRKDALWMIIKNKNIYLDLLKTNLEIPVCITRQAQKDLKTETKLNMDVSSLPRILMDIAIQEMRDISIDVKEDRISSVVQKQLTHLVTQPADAAAWKSETQLDAILEADEKADSSLGSVKDVHQVVTLDMSGSPTHPHLEVRPT